MGTPSRRLAAPGVGVVSTTKGGGYEAPLHASMASPHVAGAAALVIASGMSAPAWVRARLQETALDRTFYTTGSSDGILDIDFTTLVDNAKVSAIEVVRQK